MILLSSFDTFIPDNIDLTGMDRREVVGDWEQSIHPSGATYYYNARRVSIDWDFRLVFSLYRNKENIHWNEHESLF